MLNKEAKGKNLVVVLSSIFLIAFALITINIKSDKTADFLESPFVWIVSPFQSLFTSAVDSVSEVVNHYLFLVEVSRENEALKRQVALLKQEKNRLREQLLHHERIRNLLERQGGREGRVEAASVIGRDATQWSKVVFIDKGVNRGIRENYAVVTHLGVVGRVIQAGANASKVLLITDSRSAVDVLFQGSRVSGVMVGTGGEECDVRFVPIDAVVHVGDKIISSGMGAIFPKGLVVGTVARVTKKKQGLFQKITATPNADLARLEEVLVLLRGMEK
ncbi:MAG: rod shape-determining protein MreC [Nitrospinales bacterium]